MFIKENDAEGNMSMVPMHILSKSELKKARLQLRYLINIKVRKNSLLADEAVLILIS
jgi:hypothetical protein